MWKSCYYYTSKVGMSVWKTKLQIHWRNHLIFLKFMMRNISEVNSRLKCKFNKAFLPFFILAQIFVIFLCGIYKNTNGSCTKSIFLWFFFQYRLLFYVFSEYDNIKWEDHFSIIVFFLYDGWLSKKMSLVKTFLLLWTTKHHKETAGKKQHITQLRSKASLME